MDLGRMRRIVRAAALARWSTRRGERTRPAPPVGLRRPVRLQPRPDQNYLGVNDPGGVATARSVAPAQVPTEVPIDIARDVK
jgi:hypothetical protein